MRFWASATRPLTHLDTEVQRVSARACFFYLPRDPTKFVPLSLSLHRTQPKIPLWAEPQRDRWVLERQNPQKTQICDPFFRVLSTRPWSPRTRLRGSLFWFRSSLLGSARVLLVNDVWARLLIGPQIVISSANRARLTLLSLRGDFYHRSHHRLYPLLAFVLEKIKNQALQFL